MHEPLFERTIDLATGSTLTNRVYATLKDRILSRSLPPGARLKHAELATALGVSITPVREAIVELEKDGLVEVIPYRGSLVKEMSAEEICDVYEVRISLESLAARLAASRITDAQLEELEGSMRDYETAVDRDDMPLGLHADLAFHMLILRASGNRVLLETANRLANRIQVFRQMDWREASERQSLRGHRAISEALFLRDADAAAESISQHITRGKMHVLRLFEPELQ
jgi:DNA-binding GntR family transcriptional regulator